MKPSFLVCAALLLPSAANAAEQFDLKCTGERQMDAKSPAKPHSYGFRIDLKANKWCWEHCDRIYDIVSVHPDRLILTKQDTQTSAKSLLFSNEVDRTSGRHELVSIESRPIPSYFKITGQCEAVAFSGFPSTKF